LISYTVNLGDARYSIAILGFRNCSFSKGVNPLLEVLEKLRKEHLSVAQAFDAELIATDKHLLSSFIHAFQAFSTSRNVSRSLSTEMLLYAAATNQIKSAIDSLGVKTGSQRIVIFLADESDESVKTSAKKILDIFREICIEDDSVLLLDEGKVEKIKDAFKLDSINLLFCNVKDIESLVVKCILERIAELHVKA